MSQEVPVVTRAAPRPSGPRTRGAVIALALCGWVLAACSPAPSQPAPSQSPPAPRTSGVTQVPPSTQAPAGGPVWLVTRSALAQLVADPVVRNELRSSRIYEILPPGQHPLAGVSADPVVTFASAAALEDAIRRGQLAAGTYGVLYDPEAWSFTPATEQRDPVRAAARAAAVAHAHGLRIMVAPALNLTTVLNPGDREPRWRQFLSLNLAGQLARVADFVELQAQSLERDTATYAFFVRAATSQAVEANPRVAVLAGLSTNPPGAPVDGHHLTAAIQATRATVTGYWLNIPGQGALCPTCNAPRPDIAIQAVRAEMKV